MPIPSSQHHSKEVFQRIAARLSNTGQVLSAWGEALEDRDPALQKRLRRASRGLSLAVGALNLDGETQEPDERAGESDLYSFGLSGRSEVISLVEFLSFLASMGRDGVLKARTAHEDFVIELRGGFVVHAACMLTCEGPGLGEIPLSGLGGADAEGAAPEEPAGREELTRRALQVFLRAHRAGSGFDFRFEENARIPGDEELRLSVSHLLLESARMFDEDERITMEAADSAPTGAGEDDRLGRFRAGLDQALGSGVLALPVLPGATAQLLSMCWSEEFDAEDFKECVDRDQSLCAHLLRIANSALYAPVTPISSVQLAIMRIGLDKLREVTMALTLKQKVFELPGWKDLIHSLWRTAAVTSGFAGALGKRCGTGAVRGSMVGLLQDVGKPIVLDALYSVEENIGVELTPDVALTLMEEYHGRLGSLLVEKWSLPEWLGSVVSHHHDYAEAAEYRLEAMVGNFATELARWAENQEEIEIESLETLPVCEELGLDSESIRSLLDEVDRIRSMADVYD